MTYTVLSIIVAALFVGLVGYVRLAPSDPEVWHVDPATGFSGAGQYLVAPGGDQEPPVFPESPEELLTRFDAIALGTPRTQRLAGSVAQGRVTYITRSAVIGFPDYTSVAAVPVEGGAALHVFARLRFGQSDLGVNAKRVQGWLDAL